MNVLSMVFGKSVSEETPHSVDDLNIDFGGDFVGVLLEVEDCRAGFLYFRLLDADGREVERSTNVVLLARVPYLQIPWVATIRKPGPYAVECRWETGGLLKRRYVRRIAG